MLIVSIGDNEMNNRLVLTGVTNNPGRILVERLAANKELVDSMFPGGVVSVFRESSDTSHYDATLPQADKYICDLANVEKLKTVFKDADTILHMAGIHWSDGVVVAAAACHVRRLIVVHTCGVYSKYKAAGEQYRQIDAFVKKTCKDNSIILTILRPTMIYGNLRDRNIIKFIKMVDVLPLMPVVSGGRYDVQPVHYADLGEAFFDVLNNEDTTKGMEFILSGDRPILLRDMFTIIGETLGKRIHFISCPLWIAYLGAVVIYGLSMGKADFREKVLRLCEPRAYGHDEATKAFGFSPRSFDAGISEEIEEYKKR